MIAVVIVIAAVVVALIAVAYVVMGRRRRPDGVAAFQRQIDALSSEARRPVVDQVQQLEGDAETDPAPDDDDDRDA